MDGDKVNGNGTAVAPEAQTDRITDAPAEVKPIRGLSLWQPWASLIAWGEKRIETRSRGNSYRGPLAILATKVIEPDAIFAAQQPEIAAALERHGATLNDLPLGAVVAVADMVDDFQFGETYDPGEPERHFGDFTSGRYGYRLENIRALPEPIPCQGSVGIFTLPSDVAEKIWTALESLPATQASDASETPAPSADKPGSDAPEQSPEQLRKQLAAIEAAERFASNRLAEWEDAKAAASEAKKAYDEAVEDLCEIIRRHNSPLPLFDKAPASEPENDASRKDANSLVDAWRSVPLADINLDAKIVAKLAEFTPALTTLGELADYTATPHKRLTDIPGIGEKAAEKIEAATYAYYAAHPIDKPATPAAVLKWEDYGTDGPDRLIFAPNTAGIEVDADILSEFVVKPEGSKFGVIGSHSSLMPEEFPGDFDTIDDAKAWCERRNAELVAQAKSNDVPNIDTPAQTAADFDDDKLGIPETIVMIERKLRIEVSQRAGGRWASNWFAHVISNTYATKLEGHHATRAEAITAAADACQQWIKRMELTGKAKKQATEIVAALDKLDKLLADDPGSARDDNAQAVREELATA